MTKLTTERLERKIKNCIEIEDCQVMLPLDAAQELLAFREAAKNPVAWTSQRALDTKCQIVAFTDEDSAKEYGEKHGWEVISPVFLSPPVLPKQPELPQGFTYESGILTANLGNGDVLISDTHWPESGHAGISFAPVPQPKRPNLSDYTDLMGGSKTEDIGTLFIVKSNSTESLIVIRDKLDIAISALSPAPAQPVRLAYKLPDVLDYDCEFEEGDYDIDEEPWLRGRVDGFNEALQIIKRSLNAKQNSTAQESE